MKKVSLFILGIVFFIQGMHRVVPLEVWNTTSKSIMIQTGLKVGSGKVTPVLSQQVEGEKKVRINFYLGHTLLMWFLHNPGFIYEEHFGAFCREREDEGVRFKFLWHE